MLECPLASTPGDGSRSTWGDPAYPPLAPQFWGTRECILPQNWGAGGRSSTFARGLRYFTFAAKTQSVPKIEDEAHRIWEYLGAILYLTAVRSYALDDCWAVLCKELRCLRLSLTLKRLLKRQPIPIQSIGAISPIHSLGSTKAYIMRSALVQQRRKEMWRKSRRRRTPTLLRNYVFFPSYAPRTS